MDVILHLQQLAQQYLKDKYLISDYPVKDVFQSKYQMDFDYFINHIVFEVLYDMHVRNDDTTNIMNFYRMDILKKPGLSGTVIENMHPEYKTTSRYYEKFRKHNDNVARNFGAEETDDVNIQFRKLITPQEKREGHRLRTFQGNQLIHVKTYKIFDYIRSGMLGDIKKVSRDTFETEISKLEDIYGDIKESNVSLFRKSLHFYQLELMCNFEYFYSIASAMRRTSLKREDYKKVSFPFSHTSEGWMQNKFIQGRINYIEKHASGLISLNQLLNELRDLSTIKWHIKCDIMHFDYGPENEKALLSLDENSTFFELYGSGRHIQGKNWKEVKSKDFRDLYRF